MLTGRDQADKQSRNCASILSPVQTITQSFYRASGIVVRSKGSSNVELAFCAPVIATSYLQWGILCAGHLY